MSVQRLLLQQTLRGSRNWLAVAARQPTSLASQTLEGTSDAGGGPFGTSARQHGIGRQGRRGFRLTSLLGVNVEVGSMGESITEGTIASIAKRPGDAVAVDDVLFQIDTDKVTIDVRAQEAGVMEDVMVKEDDTVTVGQVIAKIGAGEASSSTEAPPPQKEQEPPAQQPEAAPASEPSKPASEAPAEAPAESPEPAHREPSIKFPPRRTPDGRRISDLPAEEQQQFLGAAAEPAEPPQPGAKPQQPAQAAAKQERHAQSMFGSSTWYAGRERGTKLSQSRVLTEREMEMIELGGAPE